MTEALGAAAVALIVVLSAAPRPGAWVGPRSGWAMGAIGALVILALAYTDVLSVEAIPVLALATVLLWAGHRQVRSKRRRVVAERRSMAVIDMCDGLAADLRAGRAPSAALNAAAREWPEFAVVADASRLGSDVPDSLRRLAQRPGAHGLRIVAAAWVISHRSGAGLADAVALAARAVRDERRTARIVETEMASARATARLLSVLPLGILLMSRGTGGDPFDFLLGHPVGLVCLCLGLLLTWTGLAWLERIARAVSP